MKNLILFSFIVLGLTACDSGSSSTNTSPDGTIKVPDELNSLVLDYQYKNQTCYVLPNDNTKSVRKFFIKKGNNLFSIESDNFDSTNCEDPNLNPVLLQTGSLLVKVIDYTTNQNNSLTITFEQVDMTLTIWDLNLLNIYNNSTPPVLNGGFVLSNPKSVAGLDNYPVNGRLTTVNFYFQNNKVYLDNEIYE